MREIRRGFPARKGQGLRPKSNRLTGPTRDAYLALGHSRLSKDLNALNGFLPKWNYPSTLKTVSSEWGSINNVRILLSSVGSIDPQASRLGADVYNLFIQGLESVGCVEQDNFSSKFLYRPAVYSDPLFQNVTVGTVFAQVPKLSGYFKSLLIDLEALRGDRAEGVSHRERLSEENSAEYATV